MADRVAAPVEFLPSQVDGLTDVRRVRFDAEVLIVETGDGELRFSYSRIARWHFPAPLWRLVWRLGWRRVAAPVGERYWHTDHRRARMRFFTSPRLTIWMPADGHLPYESSPWVQIQQRLGASGFFTLDMT